MGSIGASTSAATSSQADRSIPETALAAVLTGPYGDPYTIEKLPVPRPSTGEALVRLAYSGVCHGDIYARDGGGPAPASPVRPLIGGHEGVGTIVAVGEATGGGDGGLHELKFGDLVGVAWRSYVCGTCDACTEGAENFCFNQKITGVHRDGTYQRYLVFPTAQLVRVPTGMSLPSVCPILCAGVTTYRALKSMDPRPGKWCAVVGAAGGLGHLAIQYARAMGLKVLAIDGGGSGKEEFCVDKMGADAYVAFTRPDVVDAVRAETNGGPSYVLVLSPHQSCYDDAGEYSRFGAQIMAIGIGNLHMPLRPILKKNLLIRSSQTGTKADIQEALKLCAAGKVTPVFEITKLDSLNEALDRVKAGKVDGKLVLDMRDGEATW